MMCFFFHVITAITSTSLLASFGMIGCVHMLAGYTCIFTLLSSKNHNTIFSQ